MVATVVLFAALHSYRGCAEAVDVGLYGAVVLTACILVHMLWNTIAATGLRVLF